MTDVAPRTAAILVVDDDEPTLRSVARVLGLQGMSDVVLSNDSRKVMSILQEQPVAAVVLDLVMPHIGGEELLDQIMAREPDMPVILVTGEDDVDTAVRCMKRGAVDYILKPVRAERLVTAVRHALELSALKYEAARLREHFCAGTLSSPEAFAAIVTDDPAMLRLFAYLEAVSRGSQPVLITGETGTGKEMLARALHDASGRSGPFIAVNVAGLDDAMFSDTLFGHCPGAFTGAVERRGGMVEQAGHGTLFLDEIGDLAEASQVKLLRLVQEREYHPLGSDTTQPMHARVVAATHQDPTKLRMDLYYRLRSYRAQVPPLRERLGDLPLLVDHFLMAAAADLGRPVPKVPPELFLHLENHTFPGNVRELQATVFDAVARTSQGVVPIEAFMEPIGSIPEVEEVAEAEISGVQFPFPLPSLRAIERAAVSEAMRRVSGNQSAAARMLRISRATVARHQAKPEAEE